MTVSYTLFPEIFKSPDIFALFLLFALHSDTVSEGAANAAERDAHGIAGCSCSGHWIERDHS